MDIETKSIIVAALIIVAMLSAGATFIETRNIWACVCSVDLVIIVLWMIYDFWKSDIGEVSYNEKN